MRKSKITVYLLSSKFQAEKSLKLKLKKYPSFFPANKTIWWILEKLIFIARNSHLFIHSFISQLINYLFKQRTKNVLIKKVSKLKCVSSWYYFLGGIFQIFNRIETIQKRRIKVSNNQNVFFSLNPRKSIKKKINYPLKNEKALE